MKKLFIPFSLSLFLLSQGCVDNQYDGDIDMNVQLAGNGLSAPIGETSKFTLNDLIGEDDKLKINGDSAYYISETSNSTAKFPTMDTFNIDNGLDPDITPTPLDIPKGLEDAVALGQPYDDWIRDVKVKDAVDIDPKDIDVPKEVIYIDSAYFEKRHYATLTFKVNLFETQGERDSFDLYLSNLEGDLPPMLILSNGSNKGDTTLLTNDGKAVIITDHHFRIEEETKAEGGVFTQKIPIYGIYGRDYFDIVDGTLKIVKNGFKFEGDANISVRLQSGTAKLLPLNEQDAGKRPHIETDFVIDHLNIFRVFGEVDASAEENFSIEIGSMPDFLNDEGVRLDLYPYIKLQATNPMGVPVEASLSIKSQTEDGVAGEQVNTTINMLPATYNSVSHRMDKKQCYFYLSDNKPELDENGYVNVNDTLYTWVEASLSNLLENGVPELLDVSIDAHSDKSGEHEIVLSSDSNNVVVDCNMTVPMEFGDKLHINYSEVEDGLDDVFQDFSLDSAKINIDYTTTLPLDLTISLQGLEEIAETDYRENNPDYIKDEKDEDEDDAESNNGNKDKKKELHYYKVLKDISIKVLGGVGNSGTIKGCSDSSLDATPTGGKVIASLKALDRDALKKLTAIRYTLSGDPANTSTTNDSPVVGTLRNTQYLQLKMTATISGVSVDLDSL